jgi:hypothetical protein
MSDDRIRVKNAERAPDARSARSVPCEADRQTRARVAQVHSLGRPLGAQSETPITFGSERKEYCRQPPHNRCWPRDIRHRSRLRCPGNNDGSRATRNVRRRRCTSPTATAQCRSIDGRRRCQRSRPRGEGQAGNGGQTGVSSRHPWTHHQAEDTDGRAASDQR